MNAKTGWPSSLILNGYEISYADIASGIQLESPTEFEKNTLEFAHQWLSGADSFKLETSGSTGNPKSIVLARRTMQVSAANTSGAIGLSTGDRALVCIPTSFIGGKMMIVRGFELGLKMVAVEPSSSPLENLSDSFFDFTAWVPMQMEKTLDAGSQWTDSLNRMKCILVGGASISPRLESKIQNISAPIFATYGMTETASHIALRRLNGAGHSDFFQALDGIEIGQDSRNCLQIDAPLLLETTLVTNDIVELVGENQFRWLGRVDNVINSGGLNIYPEQVEKDIMQLFEEEPLNRRFFLASEKDNILGERLIMIIEGPEFPDDEKAQILIRLKSKLNRNHSPKSLSFVPQFPETANGKIRRRASMALRQ